MEESNQEVKMNQNISNQSNLVDKQEISFTSGKISKKNTRVKPKFFKLLGQIMNNHIDSVLSYLDLPDLAKTRIVNKLFLTIIHEYYPKRLKHEVEMIKSFQEYNYDFFEEFMKIIDSQIPLSNKNWLDFDLNSVIKKIKVLDKKAITDLKGIKNLGKLTEAVFAPFCILFGYNKTSNSSIKSDGWKKMAHKLLNESDFYRKLQSLDLDNLNDADMLDAFVYLNLPEIEIENIRRYSPVLENLILFCQAVVSYHVLIHPFIYRNDKTPQMLPGSDMHSFVVTMNRMLNRFYKFKRFLINLNIMNIPLAEYVFNLQHNREEKITQESLIKSFDDVIIGNILSFIPHSESNKLMSIGKKWREGFKVGMDYVINEILKEVFFLKIQASEKLYKRLPILYDNNIFSSYFLMIDDIINGENLFLSKEQINDIKNIKIENDVIRTVSKLACLILNEKPNRKSSSIGDITILYLDKIKLLAISGQLNKAMKNINKLDMNQTKINQIHGEISNFASVEKLEEIKKMNRGIYQLLIWELFVFEFHKNYNPFEFISSEFIISKFDKDDVDIIKYYCEVMNYLKFNLKIKFKFNKGNFDFKKLFDELKQSLFLQKVNTELVFDNSQEYSKISKIYFETKDLIPPGAKPAFFERIYNEIVKSTSNLNKRNMENLNEISGTGYTGLNVGSLGTIREESSINEKMMMDKQYANNKDKLVLNHFNSKSSTNKKAVSYNDIPNEIIIKHFLFFLDITSLPRFSTSNRKSNECVKTHIFIRLHFLNKEKKIIEHENQNLIQQIDEKRKEFFEEYEIQHPKYEHATQLMQRISNNDIIELKQCFKKYNKNYEEFVSPVVILFGEKAQTKIKPDGTKVSSFFLPTQKLLNSNDFFKKLMNFELETIPHQRFKNVSKIIESPTFSLERIKQLSPCLYNLLMWVIGVIEFHKVIRKYSLSSYDHDILNENEINFSSEMDNIMLLYYKLLRYANTFCKNYEKSAQQIMISMNIISDKNK